MPRLFRRNIINRTFCIKDSISTHSYTLNMALPSRYIGAVARHPKYLPVLMVSTAGTSMNFALTLLKLTPQIVTAIAGVVRLQLASQSNKMDHIFSQYNTPESEESRRKTFDGHPDPRTNILNFLSWK